MFLTSTVEIQYYIEKNNLEVNPNTEYSTRKDFIEKVNSRDVNGDWTYIHFPDDGNQPIVDLSGFISFWSADISKLLPYSVTPDTTELKRLRLYCYSAYTDSMFVIDLNYIMSDTDYYRLDNVIVYDECHKEEYFKYTFKIGNGVYSDSINPGYISSVKFNADRFELKIELTYEGE